MNKEEAKKILTGLSVAENMGDVAEYLPRLCRLFDLPEPAWDDDCGCYIMAWDDAS